MKNIDLFDIYTAYALSVLYQGFPRPQDLDYNQVIDAHHEDIEALYGGKIENATIAEPGEESIQLSVVWGFTIGWLYEAGYILAIPDEGATITNVATRQLTLSAKSLEALKASPASLETTESLGERLMRGTLNLRQATGKSLVQHTVSKIISLVAGFP